MSDNSPAANSLAALTTLGLGGPAARLVTAVTSDEVTEGLHAAAREREPVLLLAGGSNVVVADEGFPGTVLLIRSSGSRAVQSDAEHVLVQVEAGQPWDEFVLHTVLQGWSGVECLSGIPGAAGATPIQNVGAYGQDVSQSIASVTVYDRTEGTTDVFSPEQCRFGYRTSVFKHTDRWAVLDVTFRLRRDGLSTPVSYGELARSLGTDQGKRVPLEAAREAVLDLRRSKGMVLDPADPDTRSVGSFFTNPVLSAAAFGALLARSGDAPPAWPGADGVVKVPAAWLIEHAGFVKGYRRGPVSISSKHTLALTNPGDGGTCADLLALAGEIRDGVHDRFGVTLHPEPVLVNCTF